MIIRKILLAASAAALMSAPAFALPSQAPANAGNGHAPSTTPNKTNKGHKGKGHGKPSHPGKSHKCRAHRVAYVASGTLVSQTLTKNTNGTYSGAVTVTVTRTNRHGSADKGKEVTYTVTNTRVKFGLKDTNADGTVGLDDLAAGDRVHLNGRITTLAKKCSQSGFTAETTIRQIVFHAPAVS